MIDNLRRATIILETQLKYFIIYIRNSGYSYNSIGTDIIRITRQIDRGLAVKGTMSNT